MVLLQCSQVLAWIHWKLKVGPDRLGALSRSGACLGDALLALLLEQGLVLLCRHELRRLRQRPRALVRRVRIQLRAADSSLDFTAHKRSGKPVWLRSPNWKRLPARQTKQTPCNAPAADLFMRC